MVVCKVNMCGYYSEGFCGNPVPAVNEHGFCSHVFKGNVPRQGWQTAQEDKIKEIIEDGSIQEYDRSGQGEAAGNNREVEVSGGTDEVSNCEDGTHDETSE